MYYELLFPCIVMTLVSLFAFLIFVGSLFVIRHFIRLKKFKSILLSTGAMALALFFSIALSTVAYDDLNYLVMANSEEQSFKDELTLEGEAQVVREKYQKLAFRYLKVVSKNSSTPVEVWRQNFGFDAVGVTDVPDYTFKKFLLVGRTHFINGKPFMFEAEGERMWFLIP